MHRVLVACLLIIGLILVAAVLPYIGWFNTGCTCYGYDPHPIFGPLATRRSAGKSVKVSMPSQHIDGIAHRMKERQPSDRRS